MPRRLFAAIFFSMLCLIQLTALADRASAATAQFLRTDASTKGNWPANYGSDGYYLANSVSSAPSYATVTPQAQLNYTWASNTSDPRALLIPNTSSGIAAAWYSPSPFSVNINFTDSATHQVALYVLDWDSGGRIQQLKITDASTGAPLDTETVSSFTGGTYVVWNISGSVVITVTAQAGANGVVNGVFFGSAGTSGGGGSPESVTITPGSVGLSANGQEQFTANVTNGTSQAVSWGIVSVTPSGGNAGSFSGSTPGLYTAPSSITGTATVTIKATTADQMASATATVNLSAGSTANFVGTDGLTQGSWQGTYGTDGYALSGSLQSVPSYASFAVENAQTYTWNPNTTDPRALQIPNSGGGVAAAWYSSHFSVPPTFTLDVNLVDGQAHQIALYALDWDGQGRAESVQVLDANTNAVLDSRIVSNFSGGAYLIWNVSGHVLFNVTETVGPNCVISGVFFGGSNGSAISVAVQPSNVFLGANQQQQFAATVIGTATSNITWSINPQVGSISATGLYTAPSLPSNGQTVTVSATQQGASKPGTAKVNLTTGAVANFLATDTGTQGKWQGTYGGDGYAIANGPSSLPSYGSFIAQNTFLYTWMASTADARALQIPGGSGIASAWYNAPTFSFSVNLSDGKAHQISLYALDWDAKGRAETVQVVDASSGQVLDTRSVNNFTNGVYLIWNISGNVTINVTCTGGANAAISGIFFGGGSGNSITVTPPSVSLSASQTQQFSAIISGPAQGVTWSVSGGGNISSSGLYQAPATITGATTVTITATGSNGITGTASVLLSPGSTASFQGFDTSTQGAWQTKYGSAGYSIAGSVQQLPANTTFSVTSNNGIWVWTGSTTDPRALQNPSAPGTGFAACWYKNHESFALNIGFSDSNTHQVSLYAVDWDSSARSESVIVLDAATGKVLDTEELSNFNGGVYLKWNITGSVTINVTVNSGSNGVISGAFFQ
jgi:hypothetical protein